MDAELEALALARLGQRVDDKYRLDALLGVGGMGAVYAATHRFTDRQVALKVLHPKFSKGHTVQRFLQEAKVAAAVGHAGIADVLDAGEAPDGTRYLAMERLEGQDLGQLVKARAMSPRAMQEAAIQVLDALGAAHAQGFVHRDIKPANLFVVGDPRGAFTVKVLDFGVARRVDGTARRLTQAGAVVGTPFFMSPEQLCGEAVDGRADLWALAVVLYYGLCGVLPYRADNYVALLTEMLRHGPPALGARAPEVDPALVAVVERALSPALESRFATAAAMRAALEACRAEGAPPPRRRSPTVPADTVEDPRPPPTPQTPGWANALDALEGEIAALTPPKEEAPEVAGRTSRLAAYLKRLKQG